MAAETSGRLKVIIIQGKELVFRDFRTSDPYVVVKLGEQEVFDKDLFKGDDKMGRASFNLQLMQSASRLNKIQGMSAGETTLRKVVPERDNCFEEEYSMRCDDDEVVQDIWLRLRGVQSGEIQVRMKYVEQKDQSGRN